MTHASQPEGDTTESLRAAQIELQERANNAVHEGWCWTLVKTSGHCDCRVDLYRRGADALATALERLEAAEQQNERVMQTAVEKVTKRPGEVLYFFCAHCGQKTALVVDALVAALARSTEEATDG